MRNFCNNLKNQLIQTDQKAFDDEGTYWRQFLFGIEIEIASLEQDKQYSSLDTHKKEFPQIKKDDLPF